MKGPLFLSESVLGEGNGKYGSWPCKPTGEQELQGEICEGFQLWENANVYFQDNPNMYDKCFKEHATLVVRVCVCVCVHRFAVTAHNDGDYDMT